MMVAEQRQCANERFWRFSLDRYRRPGVSELCLHMQDEADADVNFLLFGLWCAQEGIALGAGDISALDGAGAGEWREAVVRPLRAARRAMKTPPAAFDTAQTEQARAMLKRVELESERLQQVAMADAAEAMGLLARASGAALPAAALAGANLAAYFASRGGAAPAGDRLDELVRLTID